MIEHAHIDELPRTWSGTHGDEPSAATQGQTRVAIFVEVEGAGDYLPPYSGNLDIMTAAATQVGENIARSILGGAA